MTYLSVYQIEFAAKKAWTCWVMMMTFNSLQPEELPLVGGVGATGKVDPSVSQIAQDTMETRAS